MNILRYGDLRPKKSIPFSREHIRRLEKLGLFPMHMELGNGPGGAIGWRMLPVDSMLRKSGTLPLVTRSTGMRDVVLEMTSTGKGVAGVVDDHGNLIGIITDGDLRRSFDRMLIATAGEIMTASPKTVASGTRIEEAFALMSEAKITVIFVMQAADPRKPAGVIHIHDIASI